MATLSLADMPENGGFPGLAIVYALREARTGEVLKYGCTSNLRRRIFGNYLGGIGGRTTQRIYKELFGHNEISHIEIAWIVMDNPSAAKLQEQQLRADYKRRVGKLPIWDLVN